MQTRQRPASLWVAFVFIIVALVLTTGRTLWDVYDMGKTRDELAMSGVWAEAVWCNVAIWIALGLPLLGAMAGLRYCRFIVAGIAGVLTIALFALMRLGHHTINPWAVTIVLSQALGALLLFVPTSNHFFQLQAAKA